MDKLMQYIDRYHSLVLRQRLLLLLSFMSVIYMVFYFLCILPIASKKQNLVTENAYLSSLEEELIQLKAEQEQENKALDIVKLNNKLFDLKNELDVLNLELKEYFSISSSTDDLMAVVKDLVVKTQGMSLERIRLLPTEMLSLNLPSSLKEDDFSGEKKADDLTQNQHSVYVYKHKVYIEVKGDYSSLTDYLKKIESLEWGLFVQRVNYKLEEYPLSMAIIELYSLSLEGGGNAI